MLVVCKEDIGQYCYPLFSIKRDAKFPEIGMLKT
jgi:hypothetical protein